MINKHLNAVAALTMIASSAVPLSSGFGGGEGGPASYEDVIRKREEKAFGKEDAIAKAREKMKRKKKRNKLLVKLGGLNAV